MIPHYNYFPPSGSVLDENEPTAYWNGKQWQKNKKNYAVPSGHRLVGRPGGPLAGWSYDWTQRAWIEPERAASPAMTPVMRPRPMRPAQRPSAKPATKESRAMDSSKCDPMKRSKTTTWDVIEVIKVISYIAGPIVVAIGQTLKAPDRPTVNAAQPQWLIEENQNRFIANASAFESRKGVWTNIGQSLLTFGSSGLSKGDREDIAQMVRGATKSA